MSAEFDYQQLDEIIHSRIRLAVMALLAAVDDAEFSYVRDRIQATDGNLGAHLRTLEDAGYIHAGKSFVDRKPMTRYHLTALGRRAFAEYVDRINQLLRAGKRRK
ncbi:MAG TPA: transcriptional regulator [Gemmatimonadaceae bacterium]|nr:transcriptional regulator [Gemmatimonadaceae bacterium]